MALRRMIRALAMQNKEPSDYVVEKRESSPSLSGDYNYKMMHRYKLRKLILKMAEELKAQRMSRPKERLFPRIGIEFAEVTGPFGAGTGAGAGAAGAAGGGAAAGAEAQPSVEREGLGEEEESLVESKSDLAFLKDVFYLTREVSEKSRKDINLKYPLIPLKPKPGETIYAWVNIRWDPKSRSLVYFVYEPELTGVEKEKLDRIKKIIEDKIDVPLELIGPGAARDYLRKLFNEIITLYGIAMTPRQKEVFEYYILRDFVGLGKIQPLMNDPNLEDISCDGVNIPIFVYHRDPRIGSLKTNIVFTEKQELDDFVVKLAQRCGRSISVSQPLLEGSLPDGSRVHAVLGTDVARRGSNFTIRKFTKKPLTPVHLLEYRTINEKALAYLWFAIEHNSSLLIAGPTAAGKTTLLNSLSLFIRPEAKIVSIEDTPELKLPHQHWIPEVARSAVATEGGKKFGEVTMFDLLKGSLRQRPDYVIVGEVRGEETYVLFQEMATGHAGLATIHADSLEKILDRLTTPPINLPPALLEILDIIVIVKRFKYRGEYVRKVTNIYEIKGYDPIKKKIICTEVFRWNPKEDELKVKHKSYLLEKIREQAGMSPEELAIELDNREKVLEWAKKRGIRDYRDLGKLFGIYYSDPHRILDVIGD